MAKSGSEMAAGGAGRLVFDLGFCGLIFFFLWLGCWFGFAWLIFFFLWPASCWLGSLMMEFGLAVGKSSKVGG
jgi:hypothetical protein